MNSENILKYCIYLGVAVLLYVPFIVANGMFFPYITGKAFTFRIIVELIIALWAILAVLYPVYRPRKSWILYTFGAFLISIFVSDSIGVNQVASFWSNYERMEGWVTLAHLFGLFLALGSVLRDKKEWYWLFNASIVASIFMVFSAIGEIMEYAKTVAGIENGAFGIRVDTTLGNSTYLGIYMLMNAFLSILLLFKTLKEKASLKNWWIYLYATTFILQSWIVFQTGTRGSMLGLIGGLILTSGLIVFLNKENKLLRKISMYLLGAVLFFVAFIFAFRDTALIQNFQPLNRITHITLNEGTTQARITNWQIATEGFKEKPIFGWGQSNFNYVFDKHYLPKHYGNEVWFDRVHNIFFDWLIAGGVWGLFFYLSIWLSLIWAIFKTKKFNINEKAVLVGLLAGYFFHNLFVFDQIVSYIYFVFILAFVYSQTSDVFSSLQKDISEQMKNILVSIIIVLIPFVLYFVNYNGYKANKELLQAVILVQQLPDGRVGYYHENGLAGNLEYLRKSIDRNTYGNAEIRERLILMLPEVARIENLKDTSVLSDYMNLSVEEMQKQIDKYPDNSRYLYILGTFFAQIGRFDLSEQYLLKAIEISPNKQYIRLPLISVYSYSDQGEKAIALAKETFELDESKDDLWIEYMKTVSKFDAEQFNSLINESIENGENERVEKLLTESVINNPELLQARVSLAAFYFKIDKASTSLEILDQAIIDFPDSERKIKKLKDQIAKGIDPIGQEF